MLLLHASFSRVCRSIYLSVLYLSPTLFGTSHAFSCLYFSVRLPVSSASVSVYLSLCPSVSLSVIASSGFLACFLSQYVDETQNGTREEDTHTLDEDGNTGEGSRLREEKTKKREGKKTHMIKMVIRERVVNGRRN